MQEHLLSAAHALLLVGIVAGFIALPFYLASFNLPRTDPDDYEDARGDWQPSGLIDYFPRQIPASATNVRLFAAPSVLQGQGTFQLRLTLPPADVEAIERRFVPRALRDSTGSLYAMPMGKPWDYTSEGRDHLPPSFTVYVVRDPHDPAWPHTSSSGLAVRRETGEVVYWTELW